MCLIMVFYWEAGNKMMTLFLALYHDPSSQAQGEAMRLLTGGPMIYDLRPESLVGKQEDRVGLAVKLPASRQL